MNLSPRYDSDPPWGDKDGFMWSKWLLHRYLELNGIDDRTESQNAEIDMILEAAFKGHDALAEVERKLKQ